LILPKVSSDAMFTVATDSSTLGIATVMLQDQGGGLQQSLNGRASCQAESSLA
jgi:hypothetical protein